MGLAPWEEGVQQMMARLRSAVAAASLAQQAAAAAEEAWPRPLGACETFFVGWVASRKAVERVSGAAESKVKSYRALLS